jgi:uncharacterized protein YcaQ
MNNPVSLSLAQARKLTVHSQLLNARNRMGTGADATLAAIEHLGYVQLDTLHVVARAHQHTLWNRLSSFRPDHIDKLQRAGAIFEHWAHALSILPMRDYRYSLPMMERIAAGEVHWYRKDKKQTDRVLARIREEGPLMARDFDDKPSSKAMWVRAPSKNALEQLFMEGELMIPYRVNFHKVYDLRERVLPEEVDTRFPEHNELSRHLIVGFLRAHTIGRAKEMTYLRRGMGKSVQNRLLELQEEGEVLEIKVEGERYFMLTSQLPLLDQQLPPSGFRILSPFDNAIIQRERTHAFFKFDYQIECYVKKENRRYGYFCLPLMYRNRLVGRLDAKADRVNGALVLLHLHIEKTVGAKQAFYRALFSELNRFASFNECDHLKLEKVSGCQEARSHFKQWHEQSWHTPV